MRAASLLIILVAARLMSSPNLYLWDDALAALIFGVLDRGLQRLRAPQSFVWLLYWPLSVYVAINVPVVRALGTPMTRPMLAAARGPLKDSILLYATPVNSALILTILAAAAVVPLLMKRIPPQSLTWVSQWATIGAIAVAAIGPVAGRYIDSRGLERNAITALSGTKLPRSDADPKGADWRSSRFDSEFNREARYDDLARYRGTARGYNVVMVGLESTAAQYLGLYGDSPDPMPQLSILSAHALVFDNAYAVYPESIKGLYSVLCSVFPAFNSDVEAYGKIPCHSIADMLSGEGYRTAMFHSGRFGYLGMESIVRNRGYQTMEDAADISGNSNSSFGVDEPATVARMLAWIDGLPPASHFFLNYLPIAGHHPYSTPGAGPFSGGSDLAQYRNALHYGDTSLGALAEGLRKRGLANSTLWVIYGDHGEAFGQHEGNYGHTFYLYEENVHVPFIVAAQNLFSGQQRVRNVVSLVDTAPTLLDLLGMPAPDAYQGRTMLSAAPRMALFFADYSLGLLGLRDGPWKYTFEAGTGRPRLYNLEQDPREVFDLSGHNTARTSWYGNTVQGWANSQKTWLATMAAR